VADSEFHALQKARGAVLTEEVGSSIRTIEFDRDGFPVVPAFEPLGDPKEAVHFGNARKEYQRACAKAVVFDLSHRGHLEFVGADRQKFLNGFCTADITNLKPGEGAEAFITSIQGKILGHVFAFAGEKSLWLETTLDSVQPLMNHLAKYVISEDVDFLPRSDALGELYVSGPLAAARLRELGVIDSDLPQVGHSQARLGKCEVHVRRVDWLDFPGFLVCMPRKGLARCWRDLVDGGVSPAGVAVFHAQRFLAGFPLYGIDITEDNLAQEAARADPAGNFM
jgi:glycine cleavage system aminomethyltransferase T